MSTAHFEKVSLEQFLKDCKALEASGDLMFSGEEEIMKYYEGILLPRRAEPGSAGYDFYMPFPAVFTITRPTMLPTGVRVILDPGQFLMCVPRSGLGFKYGMRLRNSVGVIDESYAFADNEGHIMAKICTEDPFTLKTGDRFMQGIVVNYSITNDDDPIGSGRTGGFGSTGGT